MPVTADSTRRRLPSAQRRVQIIDVALTLFAERGYYGTSMVDIASELGMRASALYRHVDGKQEILAHIMLGTMHTLNDMLVGVRAKYCEPRDQLAEAMRGHVRYHGEHQREVRVGNREISTLRDPEGQQVKDLRRRYALGWRSIISSGKEAGQFHAAIVRLAAFGLLEMGIGVAQWYRPGGPLTLDEICDEYAGMALHLVAADPLPQP